VDSNLAIVQGNLANKPKFFGTSTAEIASIVPPAGRYDGGWNSDWTLTVTSTHIPIRGGRSNEVVPVGVFAFHMQTGGVIDHVSHRTILSGY
jgi:hypothetical protein